MKLRAFFIILLFALSLGGFAFAEAVTIEDFFSPEELERSRNYNGALDLHYFTWLFLFYSIIFVIVFSDLHLKMDQSFDRLYDRIFRPGGKKFLSNLNFGALPKLMFKVVLWVLVMKVIWNILQAPWTYWDYCIRTKYNTLADDLTFWQYFRNGYSNYWLTLFKNCCSAILFIIFFDISRKYWWIFFGTGIVLISMAQNHLSQAAYNENDGIVKQTPLPEGSLRTKLEEMIKKSGVDVYDIKTTDASKRTKVPNGWVLQAGDKNVVFFTDNCLPPANTEESLINLAIHELGHIYYDHHDQRRLYSYISRFIILAIIAFFMNLFINWRYKDPDFIKGTGKTVTYAIFFLFLGRLIPFAFSPIETLWYQQQEIEAEQYALEITKDPTSMIELRKKLALDAVIRLEASPTWFLKTHPPIIKFLKLSKNFEKELEKNNPKKPPNKIKSKSKEPPSKKE